MGEEEPLLCQAAVQRRVPPSHQKKGTIRKITWHQIVLVPILFFVYLGNNIFMYVCDEWTQAFVKEQYFPNVSVQTNFSLCDIVNKSEPEYVTYENVQQKSSEWLMYFRLANSFPAIFGGLILPSLSDFYGRRQFIILAFVGTAIKICGGSIVIFAELDLFYIIIVYAVQGATNVTDALCFSYVADITNGEKQRARGIIYLDFLIVFAAVVSSLMSGVLVQTLGLGFAYTGAVCSGTVLVALFLTCMFLPETLDKQCRPDRPVTSVVKKVFFFYSSEEFRTNRMRFLILFTAFLVLSISIGSSSNVKILYLLGQPFCWGPAFIGYFSLAENAALATFGLAAVTLMQTCMPNASIAILSSLSGAGSNVVMGLARTDAMIYLAPVIGTISILLFPMMRGLMSYMTSPETQGSMFASVAVVQMVGNLLSVVENEIYSVSLSIMNGFVFLCVAAMYMIIFILLSLFCCIQPRVSLRQAE